jgi:hypothetical protein
MGLFQGLVDFYDYKVQYYRTYLYRRLLFGENDKKIVERFNIYTNNDSENAEQVIFSSFKLSLAIGIFAKHFYIFIILLISLYLRIWHCDDVHTSILSLQKNATERNPRQNCCNWQCHK